MYVCIYIYIYIYIYVGIHHLLWAGDNIILANHDLPIPHYYCYSGTATVKVLRSTTMMILG